MKKKRILLVVKLVSMSLLIFVGAVGIYMYKYHALSVEGSKLFEYRCLHVNPPLIDYKNSFLKFAYCLQNSDKCAKGEALNSFNAYISGMRAYVPEEMKWLNQQKKFMDRWDFRLFESWYIKDAATLQWKMYEGYRDDAQSQLRLYDNPELLKNFKIGEVGEERQRRDYYSQKYFEFYREATQINDWRKIFGSVPSPKGCTKENTEIPDTTGAIDWGGDSPEATPSGMPIDPYATS